MIPLIDLKKQYLSIKKEIDSAIQSVINDTAFSGGTYVEKFEKDFAKYIGIKQAIGVNSGTSALLLALHILGVKEGDEVIVPVNTFIATAWAVSYVRAKPVFVDCTHDTWQMDVGKIEKEINSKTKVIIGVHLFGQPFDVDEVKKIAKKNKLFFVEDCAQAHGARYKGKSVGTFSDIACFSFYPTKNLGAFGEGGALVTNNYKYALKAIMLRNQGSAKRYFHDEVGLNMRMDGIQAAVLSVKLRYLKKWNSRRQTIAKLYHTGIINPLVSYQYQPGWSESVYHLFVLKVKQREKFVNYLKESGIETSIHYPISCHLQKAYKYLYYKQGDFPVAEDFSRSCVSIPIFPELTDKEVKNIIKIINRFKA